MRKKAIILLVIFTICSISTQASMVRELSEKDLIQIYILALESFIPENFDTAYKENIVIELYTEPFNNISDEGKEEILRYFSKKYNREVKGVNLKEREAKMLEKKKITNKFEPIIERESVALVISKKEIKNDSEIVIEGYWYRGFFSARGATTTIVFDTKWNLKERIWTWIS